MKTETIKQPAPMKLKEIAQKIDAHLKRLEADPASNVRDNGKKGPRYFSSGSFASGRFVSVSYISFQHTSKLTKAEAEAYLSALEGGSNERHYEVLADSAAAEASIANFIAP